MLSIRSAASCRATLIALVTFVPQVARAQSPVITEFVARNAIGHVHPQSGQRHDWIEVHNPHTAPLQLRGYCLTDDRDNPTKWRFPTRTIAPGGYEIIYASGQGWRLSAQPLHTNFELNGGGEYLALAAPNGSVIASFDTNKHVAGGSYGVAIDGSVGYFETPTPGAANPATSMPGVAKKATADHPRGSYASAFSLQLATTSVGATIRYTLDGSRPTRSHGTVYRGPLQISGTTILRTVAYGAQLAASRIETYSYLFFDQVATQSAQHATLPPTWGTHTSTAGPFIRNADYGVDSSVAQSGRAMRDSLESLPVISMVVDADDMFDSQTGIYANPEQRGTTWERPASIELLYPRMGRRDQLDVGVRISGRASRRPDSNPKHSMRLVARDAYGSADFDAELFGLDGARKHNTIVLRGMFNDSFVPNPEAIYVRDMFTRDAHAEIGHDRARGIYCHLFINGLYWGLYNPSERPDAAFQAEYRDGSKDEFDVLRHHGGLVNGNRTAHNAARSLLQAGINSAADWQALEQFVDLSDLADYLLVQFYCGTNDWPGNNWYMARRRLPGEAFRFYIWDAEFALERPMADLMGVFWHEGPGLFYDKLRNNPDFQMLMADRAQALMTGDGLLTHARSLQRFEQRVEQVRPAIIAEAARWGDALGGTSRTPQDWQRSVDRVKRDFFPLRTQRVLTQLRRVGFWPSLEAPQFGTPSGVVRAGQRLTLTASAANGQIIYTTDGRDPRAIGGQVANFAQVYAGPIRLQPGMQVHARVKVNNDWSPLSTSQYRDHSLVITEVMASNHSGIQDARGKHSDWIELHNPTGNVIDASGLHLTDDLDQPQRWSFPAGTIVPAGATFIVWAGGRVYELDAEPRTNFKLDRSGDAVYLLSSNGRDVLDSVRFGRQRSDVSLGRLHDAVDGGAMVTFTQPTPGKLNSAGIGHRSFSGQEKDLHSVVLEASGGGAVGSLYSFAVRNAQPSDAVLLFVSPSGGYTKPLAASDVALLVGGVAIGSLLLPTDANGEVPPLPLPIPIAPQLLGMQVYMQCFGVEGQRVLGSNAVEFNF